MTRWMAVLAMIMFSAMTAMMWSWAERAMITCRAAPAMTRLIWATAMTPRRRVRMMIRFTVAPEMMGSGAKMAAIWSLVEPATTLCLAARMAIRWTAVKTPISCMAGRGLTACWGVPAMTSSTAMLSLPNYTPHQDHLPEPGRLQTCRISLSTSTSLTPKVFRSFWPHLNRVAPIAALQPPRSTFC